MNWETPETTEWRKSTVHRGLLAGKEKVEVQAGWESFLLIYRKAAPTHPPRDTATALRGMSAVDSFTIQEFL